MENKNAPAVQKPTVHSILSSEGIKKRFNELMGKQANSFMSSIISATKANPTLLECEPDSVISSAVIAATMNLPIQSNLGYAHIVPYKGKDKAGNPIMQAQFQMGYKGYVQLAIRTAQYKTINAIEVFEGELVKQDRISGDVELDPTKKKSNKVVGYLAYFKLINGFEKMLYWPKEQVEAHGSKYSKSYASAYGRWKQDFDAMALKTILKMLLSKYGILSIDMQTALTVDQAIIKNADTLDVDYVDGNETEKKDMSSVLESNSNQPEIKVIDKEQKDLFDDKNKKS